jgi:hypothetical protein
LRYADFAANRLVLRPQNIGFPVDPIEVDPDESPGDLHCSLPAPNSAVDWSVRLFRIISVGSTLLSDNSRNNMRKPSTIVSEHRTRIQRLARC